MMTSFNWKRLGFQLRRLDLFARMVATRASLLLLPVFGMFNPRLGLEVTAAWFTLSLELLTRISEKRVEYLALQLLKADKIHGLVPVTYRGFNVTREYRSGFWSNRRRALALQAVAPLGAALAAIVYCGLQGVPMDLFKSGYWALLACWLGLLGSRAVLALADAACMAECLESSLAGREIEDYYHNALREVA